VTAEPLIAVIDDDEPCRIAIQESLSVLGYFARGFASGDEFLATGEEASYDCVITDIYMPGISGIDLKRLLVGRGFAVPVIMMTARTESSLEAVAANCGAVCLLRKPFETDTLAGFLKAAVKT
jgi:FixJ family two-component response regulator